MERRWRQGKGWCHHDEMRAETELISSLQRKGRKRRVWLLFLGCGQSNVSGVVGRIRWLENGCLSVQRIIIQSTNPIYLALRPGTSLGCICKQSDTFLLVRQGHVRGHESE
jgi:hypothetical protein